MSADLGFELDDLIPPDLQAYIDAEAADGRAMFERECESCGAKFIPRQPWGPLLLGALSAPGVEEGASEERGGP